MSAVDEKMSTSEQVCDQLEQLIAAGGFEDGERLDENRLAQKFNTSRTPVRKAFRLLSARGHVEIRRNRGAFVRLPKFSEVVEMFEVMSEMEAWCARLAALRATRAQLILMEDHLVRCETAFRAADVATYYTENAAFHALIYEASGNAFLAQETRKLQERLASYRRIQLGHDGRMVKSMTEHRAILDALIDHDPDRASKLIRRHVQVQSEFYEAFRQARS